MSGQNFQTNSIFQNSNNSHQRINQNNNEQKYQNIHYGGNNQQNSFNVVNTNHLNRSNNVQNQLQIVNQAAGGNNIIARPSALTVAGNNVKKMKNEQKNSRLSC